MKKGDIGGYVFLAISILIYMIIGGWDFALWVAELVNYHSDDYSLWEKLSYNWSLYDIKFYFILFVGVLGPIILIFIGLLLLQGFLIDTKEEVHKDFKEIIKALRPHKALIELASDPNNSELTWTTPDISQPSIANIQVHDASIEWIDLECKDNKKLYDTKGNIIVIGNPSPKIHTMATYDINGNILTKSSVKVRTEAKKVIFLDPGDKKDEKGKLKKLYEEGYISKSRYNVLIKDLKN